MNEHALSSIFRHIEEHLFEPGKKWPVDVRADRAYSRWAAYEIIQLLMDNPFEDPRMLIEEFEIKMIAYSEVYDSHGGFNMFTIAADTANDILKGDF